MGSSPFCLDLGSQPSSAEQPDFPTQSSDTFAISKNDFEIVSLIGYGHSGTIVQLVKSRESGDYFAMKTIEKWSLIEKRNTGDTKAIDRANVERDVHVSLNEGLPSVECPYFVKFFSSFQCPRNLYFILEYCPYDVLEYINQFGPLSVSEGLLFFAEVAVAVEFLHEAGTIHRDIKMDNILISLGGHVRLSDFGSSKRVESQEQRSDSIVGFSLSIMPPEFFNGTPSYGSAVDWYQVGICVFEALTGVPPFHGTPLKSVYAEEYPPLWPDSVEIPDEVKDLVEALLHPDETERMRDLASIKSHPAMLGIAWGAVDEGSSSNQPFINVDPDGVRFVTPRMMSSVSDLDFDPLPFKSFSFIRKQ